MASGSHLAGDVDWLDCAGWPGENTAGYRGLRGGGGGHEPLLHLHLKKVPIIVLFHSSTLRYAIKDPIFYRIVSNNKNGIKIKQDNKLKMFVMISLLTLATET